MNPFDPHKNIHTDNYLKSVQCMQASNNPKEYHLILVDISTPGAPLVYKTTKLGLAAIKAAQIVGYKEHILTSHLRKGHLTTLAGRIETSIHKFNLSTKQSVIMGTAKIHTENLCKDLQ